MKKTFVISSMVLVLILFSGCNKSKQNMEDVENISPTVQPTITTPPQNIQEEFTLEDYYPTLLNTEYIYTGVGNEYASYHWTIEYSNMDTGRIQTRTNNGGTETVRVIEITDDKISVIKSIPESYDYVDYMSDAVTDEDAEVLLMEPFVMGTEWTLPDGRKRFISATDVSIETPSGTYQALEVTTKGDDGTSKDYYAPQIGLVKSVYGSGDMEVTSTLSEIVNGELLEQ